MFTQEALNVYTQLFFSGIVFFFGYAVYIVVKGNYLNRKYGVK